MKKIDLGQTVNTLANIGVIVGIVFLAVEVSQNSASLEDANTINRVESSTTAVQFFNDFRWSLAEHPDLTEIFSRGAAGEALDAVDAQRFTSVCRNLLWTYVMSHERYEAIGLQARASFTVENMRQVIRQPGLRECWDGIRDNVRSWGYDSFVRELEYSAD